MIRNIVSIDKSKCNGCGLCIKACHEGAIVLIQGKAELISDEYCDGLGDCLPKCPKGAIKVVKREAKEYDEKAVLERQQKLKNKKGIHKLSGVCSGTAAKLISRNKNVVNSIIKESDDTFISQLNQWPIQIKLINTKASYLENADLLIAGDCTAYAYGDFHNKFIRNRITLIGCPKLDDNKYYEDKITQILNFNNIKSITVVKMEVPCCSGIVTSVKNAMINSKTIIPFNEITISNEGRIIE